MLQRHCQALSTDDYYFSQRCFACLEVLLPSPTPLLVLYHLLAILRYASRSSALPCQEPLTLVTCGVAETYLALSLGAKSSTNYINIQCCLWIKKSDC